ncbi:N-terminal C2 in EEIG1 and EHBP1 proteins-domain-containing protein [Panaeolus papilionaceus]|nr:N-terminal C2 in EEIG1 and EHBP1 proteins-domain-containing protein [Panaeolus papilionaceus]
MTSPNVNVSTGSTSTTAPRIRAQLGHLLPRHAHFQAEVQIHQLSNVPLVSGEFAVRWKFKGVQTPSGTKPGLLNRVKAKAKAEKERREGKTREDVTLPSLGGIISPAGGTHSLPSPVQRSASGSQSIAPSVIAPTFTTSTTSSTVTTPVSSTPARGMTHFLPLKDHSVTWSYVLSPVLKMDIDRETHDLLPCPLKLVVLQKIDEEDAKTKGSASNPQLGVVYLNLAEYVDKDGEEENGDGSKKKKKGKKDGCPTGIERSYLLKESKTNATLKLTVRLTFLHGESNYIAPPLPQGGILTGIAGFLKQNDAVRKRPRALVLDLEESNEMHGVDRDVAVTAKTLRTATIGIGMMPGTPRSIGTMLPPRTARTLGGYGDAPFTPIPPVPTSSLPKSARVPRVLHNISQEDDDDDYSHTISVLSPITGRPLPHRSTTQSSSGTYASSPSASSPSQPNSPVFTSPSRRVIYGSPKSMSPQLPGISPVQQKNDPYANSNADLALGLLAVDIHRLPAPGFGNGLGSRTKATETLIDAIFNPVAVRAPDGGSPPLSVQRSEYTTVIEEERIRRRYETPFVRYEEEATEPAAADHEESEGTTDTEGEGYRDAEGWSDAEGERTAGKREAPDTAKPESPTTARPGVQPGGGRATRWILRKKVVATTVATSNSQGPPPEQQSHVRRNTRDSNSDASGYSVSTGTSNNTASSSSRRNSEEAGFGRRRRDVYGQHETSSSHGHESGYEIVNSIAPHNGSAHHIGDEGHAASSHAGRAHHLGTSMRDWWKRHAGSRPSTPTGIKA